MGDYEYVKLRDLKFASRKRHQRSDSTVVGNTQPIIHDRGQYFKPQNDYSGTTPYERLAADKPGGELAPEGTIWQIYVDEAKEHDAELVERENGNLDQMLLFAALFSAILTAFIIESKNFLQEDASETTVLLLLLIAQSQQRMEQGTPRVTPTIERPSFSTNMSARWINGLWFTALALSLAAALIAMLAKEWLATFKASRPRPAYAHTMVHQERLNGLTTWRALHLIDVLPTLLHMSLLLFSLGLAVYLWTLDKGVAIAEVIITVVTVTFYVATAFLGAVYPSCPFVTQISKYLQSFTRAIKRRVEADKSPDETQKPSTIQHGSEKELQALLWLSENARDPLAGDCVCQALIGLSPTEACEEIIELADNDTAKDAGSTFEGPEPTEQAKGLETKHHMNPKQYRMIKSLYVAVLARISEGRLRVPQEPDEYRGMNLAQYANALPKMAYILESQSLAMKRIEGGGIEETEKASVEAAFSAFDSIWSEVDQELSPDSYAAFSSAELQLVLSALLILQSKSKSVTQAPSRRNQGQLLHSNQRNNTTPAEPSSTLDAGILLDMESNDQNTPDIPRSLFQIRARYSRALASVGYLLSCHNRYDMHITTRPLISLLESIKSVAERSELNPRDHMSTCLLQPDILHTLPNFTVTIIPRVAYEFHVIDPLEIGDEDGLLVGLVETVSAIDIQDAPDVEFAAERALAVVGPMLLRQWVNMMNTRLPDVIKHNVSDPEGMEYAFKYWPSSGDNRRDRTAHSALLQLLIIATISVEFALCPQMAVLPNVAMRSLYRRANTISGAAAWSQLAETGGFWDLISRLAIYAYENRFKLSEDTRQLFTELLLIEHEGKMTLSAQCIWPASIPYMLRSLTLLPKDHDAALLVLNEFRNVWFREEYFDSFTQTSDGLGALCAVIQHFELDTSPQAIVCVVDAICRPMQNSSYSPDGLGFKAQAIPGVLCASRLVLPALIKDRTVSDDFGSVVGCVARLLFNTKEINLVVKDCLDDLYTIYNALEPLTNWRDELGDSVFVYGQLSDQDARLYLGLREMFDEENFGGASIKKSKTMEEIAEELPL
ncbi:hypothetical protein RhiJN_24297 [Ceratobasidium sp. AG-Ba]|nr:hypothetical protein RhiJN_24297 [Ceratobasidium sp. AG-Ba]